MRIVGSLALALVLLLPSAAGASLIINTTLLAGIQPDEAIAIGAAVSTWESLITDLDGDPSTDESLDVAFVKRALPGLGQAFGYPEDDAGLPTGGSISFDDGSHYSFFVDPTPLANEEFAIVTGLPETYGVFRDPARFLQPDLYSVMLHELAHILGFSEDKSLWDAATDDASATLYFGTSSIALRGNANGNELSHLSPTAAPYDLMLSGATFAGPSGPATGAQGARRLVTALDLEILEGVYGYSVDRSALQVIPEPGTFALLAFGVAGLGLRRCRSNCGT